MTTQARQGSPLAPRLAALSTAVPRHRLVQSDIRAWARGLFNGRVRDIERMLPAFDNAGIETRYSCMPLDWFSTPRGWAEKNARYLEHALDLLTEAAVTCLAAAGLTARDVDALVTVSTTGIATPALDARLFERLAFRAETARLPIFGLGCAGGVNGLARAAEVARARPGSKVLFLVVELCGLTFRSADLSKSNVIATALFGDGAAAALITTDGPGPRITRWGEHTWPKSLDVMGWTVEEDGLGVVFSRDIPHLVETELPPVVQRYLAQDNLNLGHVDAFVAHPGGEKVVTALETVFGRPPGGLEHARAVLRDFGNMSAATVLFVLRRTLDAGFADTVGKRALMSALGPGFTAGFLTLEAA
ncbi:MAG: chalcone synthase [Rhodospirillales bacterium CG15_BIG_FIL_POST_REV_8_21_14_020_66_15]|nr:MAG: chalcone synthase [Rhodospirillales bacterium CG15_BIG_FIL_POST_REV_8_21_14_020_66_15]